MAAESRAEGALLLSLSGDWLLDGARPSVAEATELLEAEPAPARVEFRTAELGDWDSGLVHYLVGLEGRARELGIAVDAEGLPEGAARLVRMAFAVPPRAPRAGARSANPLARLGEAARHLWERGKGSVRFLGELVQSTGRLATGRATFQRSDLWVTMQEVSAEALGIVGLIGFLVGVILAFIGAGELQKLGAGLYSANLVGLGILRELGPLMVGIIMAGRTGAAFAAQLGTMKVNEEIDALETLGIDPIDYLVLPRVLALGVMMPLLTLYGNLLGLVGGTVVSVVFLDLTPLRFMTQMQSGVGVGDLVVGLVMAAVFGILVALAGCQRGIECGSSAQAVGTATTSAVVTGIVAIVSSCAVLNMIYAVLGV